MQHLQPGTTLQGGKYKIEQVLGQGGFGITYLAENTMLNGKVAIKEFFFKEYCERDESTSHVTICTTSNRELVERFKLKFIKEARNIFKLNHPNIVHILDIFEENDTAYYVMDFAENGSLAAKVKDMGYLPEPLATRYIVQVAEALDYIHQRNMNHLDVKPGNIMLNEDDNAVLIDFGLSKQYDAQTGSQTSTTPVGISHGYAPLEQYKEGGLTEFSPETDIYALGATFFKLLTGVTPPNASDINEDGVPVETLKAKGVSDKAIAVICKAMESRKKLRMDSAREFINSLQGSKSTPLHDEDEATAMLPTAKTSEPKHRTEEQTIYEKADNINPYEDEPKSKSRKYILWGFVCAVAIIAAVLCFTGLISGADSTATDSLIVDTPQKEIKRHPDLVFYELVGPVKKCVVTDGATEKTYLFDENGMCTLHGGDEDDRGVDRDEQGRIIATKFRCWNGEIYSNNYIYNKEGFISRSYCEAEPDGLAYDFRCTYDDKGRLVQEKGSTDGLGPTTFKYEYEKTDDHGNWTQRMKIRFVDEEPSPLSTTAEKRTIEYWE